MSLFFVLIALYIILTATDALITLRGLRLGGREANPAINLVGGWLGGTKRGVIAVKAAMLIVPIIGALLLRANGELAWGVIVLLAAVLVFGYLTVRNFLIVRKWTDE